jgi:hypothetical protein
MLCSGRILHSDSLNRESYPKWPFRVLIARLRLSPQQARCDS